MPDIIDTTLTKKKLCIKSNHFWTPKLYLNIQGLIHTKQKLLIHRHRYIMNSLINNC